MSRKPRYSEQEVRNAVETSPSLAAALRKLGLRAAGGNHRTIRKLITHYGISTDHLNPKWALRREIRKERTPLRDILVEESSYHRGHLKQRLYDCGLKDRRCELCGQDESWRGRSMALILDHINGTPTDNRLENLRIVCPNCAATLETHCGRKNRHDAAPRNCLHCGKEFHPKYATHRYCSQECGVHSKGSHDPKRHTRKVPRPSYDQLLADVDSMTMRAVGHKYGVSDNAVRKWLRWYRTQAGPG